MLIFLKDECKKLFDLKASCREAQLPPKKKSINIQDFTAKISVGEEFRKKDNGQIYSPCWFKISLIKFIHA